MSLVLICSLSQHSVGVPFNNHFKIGTSSGKLFFSSQLIFFIVETSWHLQQHISCAFIKRCSHSGEF